MDQSEFIELIKSIVNTELNNRNIGGHFHLGKVDSVISRYSLKVFMNGLNHSYVIPCNPNIVFTEGDEVFIHYINGDSKDKYVPYKRATGTESYEESGGSELETYTYNQISPSLTWEITHNLNRYPNVSIVDSGGSVLYGDIQYLSVNSLKISFTSSFAGKAYIGH